MKLKLSECDQFDPKSRKWKICRGESNLPPEKVNKYREMWGMAPLYEIVKNQTVDRESQEITITFHGFSFDQKPTNKPYGPGTELLRIYEKAGVPSCEACKELAQQMNDWGVEVCRQKTDDIVEDILPRAKKWIQDNKPWIDKLLPNQVEEFGIRLKIRLDVIKAIDTAEKVIKERRRKKLDIYTGRKKSNRGCSGCGSRKNRRQKSTNVFRGLKNKPMGEKYQITPKESKSMETRELKQLFDRVVCISLDRRQDRWYKFLNNIHNCDWPFKEPEKFRAIDGTKVKPPACWRIGVGAWGCYRSHIRICEDALSDGIESVLFMEDDAEPIPEFGTKAKEFIQNVPDNWQGLFFGGEHTMKSKQKSKRVNSHVLRCHYVTRTHCFGIREPFLTQYYRFLVDFEMQIENISQHIDHAIGRFMAGGNHAIYAPTNWMVAQGATKSDIFNRQEKYRMFR